MTALGSLIRLARVGHGVSLRALADACGVTHVQMAEIERGVRQCSPLLLVELAAAIDRLSTTHRALPVRWEP